MAKSTLFYFYIKINVLMMMGGVPGSCFSADSIDHVHQLVLSEDNPGPSDQPQYSLCHGINERTIPRRQTLLPVLMMMTDVVTEQHLSRKHWIKMITSQSSYQQ